MQSMWTIRQTFPVPYKMASYYDRKYYGNRHGFTEKNAFGGEHARFYRVLMAN